MISLDLLRMPELLKRLLPYTWQWNCVIILDYMPPFPRPETQPTCVVRYVNQVATPCQILVPKGGSGAVRTSVCEYEQELRPNFVENPIHKSDWFLRHSKGPKQGHFWDSYGDDYQSPEIALIALMAAHPPPGVFGHEHHGHIEVA